MESNLLQTPETTGDMTSDRRGGVVFGKKNEMIYPHEWNPHKNTK